MRPRPRPLEELDPDGRPAALSANLYCNRPYHELLHQVVVPLGRELDALAGPGSLLWFFRYSRCGRHLKLRLHTADETRWPALRSRLQNLADAYFAAIPEGGADADSRISVPRLPPIDEEDERDEDYPDRSILWTHFRPSPRTLGSEKYLADTRLLHLFYRCMHANSHLVLASVRSADAEPPLKAKQSQLLRTVIAGLFSLDLSPEERIAYLAFHRDWHLRFLLLQSNAETTADETVERLNRKLEGMETTVAALSSIIAAQMVPDEQAAAPEEEDELSALRTSLRAFFAHVRGFRGRPEYDLDPYTSDYALLPLFKVLHSFANQIGLPPVNELYSYQLLLRATERAHAAAALATQEAGRDE